MGVPRSQQVSAGRVAPCRIDTHAAVALPEAWAAAVRGRPRGPWLYDWASARIGTWSDHLGGIGHWVLIGRSIIHPAVLDFELGTGPADTPLHELVWVAGARWAIEECFKAVKTNTGLAPYEMRSYLGWRRHVTLAMFVHAFLAVLAVQTTAEEKPLNKNPSTHRSPWARSDGS